MSMNEIEIDRVCKAVKRGARMYIGRDFSGRQKLKIVRGPFGLFVRRYECSEEDLSAIRGRLTTGQTKYEPRRA
jgi:hypothetical protein